MRHGANIPDIRALLPLLTSIDTNVASIAGSVAGANPTTERLGNTFAFGPFEQRRILLPNHYRAEIHNVGAGSVLIGSYDTPSTALAVGDSLSITNTAHESFWAESQGRICVLQIDVENNTSGAYTTNVLSDQQISPNALFEVIWGRDRFTAYDFANQDIETYLLPAFVAGNTVDVSVISLDTLTVDLVRGGFWYIGQDATTGDIYTINPETLTLNSVLSAVGPNDSFGIFPVRTAKHRRYVWLNSSDELEVYDSDFNLLNTVIPTGGALLQAGNRVRGSYNQDFFFAYDETNAEMVEVNLSDGSAVFRGLPFEPLGYTVTSEGYLVWSSDSSDARILVNVNAGTEKKIYPQRGTTPNDRIHLVELTQVAESFIYFSPENERLFTATEITGTERNERAHNTLITSSAGSASVTFEDPYDRQNQIASFTLTEPVRFRIDAVAPYGGVYLYEDDTVNAMRGVRLDLGWDPTP